MTATQDSFQQAMNQGHSAAWDQMWDRAAVYYRQALEISPNQPQALINLGLALYQLEEYEEALGCYQRAAKLNPEDPIPLEKVAQLYERIGNLDQASMASLRTAELYLKNRDVKKAVENWTRVTLLKPENLQAHMRLALVYERTNEAEKAVAEYLAVASLLQAAGDVERAVRAVNQALQIMPNNSSAIEALTLLRDLKQLPRPARPRGGTAPLRMSQVRQLKAPQEAQNHENGLDPVAQARQKALTVLAGMLFEPPEDAPIETAGRRGITDIVRGAGQMSAKQVDRSRVMLHLSQVIDLQTQGKGEQAAAELERATDLGLDNPAAYMNLGILQADTGRLESAARNLQHAAKHPDYALGARLLLADIYKKMSRLKEASIESLEALKLADAQVVPPEQADDLRQLYEPLIEANRQSGDPQYHQRLAANVRGLLMRENWRASLRKAREQLPSGVGGGPLLPLAEILTEARSSQVVESISNIYKLADQGSLQAAMEEAFYAIQQAPTYLPLHTYMGELLVKEDHLPDAIEKFMVVARTYATRGEPQRAIEMYRRILQLAPMDIGARTRLIDQLMSAGRLDEVIDEYLEMADVYYSLADLDTTRKTLTEAIRIAQQSQVDRSWRIKIMHRMADIDLQSLDWRQATRIYEQIRTMQPDDEKARASLIDLNFRLGQGVQAMAELDNYLAYLSSSNQMGKAIPFVQNLLKENPEWVLVRRRLAELLARANRTTEAIVELDAVGEALLNAGNREAAAETVKAILALNPPNQAEYQKLLHQILSST